MRYVFMLLLFTVLSCNNTTVDTPDDTKEIRDHHTMPSDVIDNLFLALNKKDWNSVDSFYSSNARIVDMANANAASASDYFTRIFSENEIYYIYLKEQYATNNGIYAKAFTRRGTRSAEFPLCFNFVIINNRIVEQQAISCDEK